MRQTHIKINPMNSKKAFTLIELMVTVIILSILASISAVKYSERKKRIEYGSAVTQARSIAAAEKSYFLTQGSYVTTTGTVNTNSQLAIKVSDGYFNNYRVNAGGSFSVLVDGGNCVYTFNPAGVRTGTNGGSDCLP